jgi:hypothetical protein
VGSVGVQCPLGDVDEGARPRPEGMAIYKDLVLPFYRVRRVVLVKSDAGRWARAEPCGGPVSARGIGKPSGLTPHPLAPALWG